jgi:hypothetical protein
MANTYQGRFPVNGTDKGDDPAEPGEKRKFTAEARHSRRRVVRNSPVDTSRRSIARHHVIEAVGIRWILRYRREFFAIFLFFPIGFFEERGNGRPSCSEGL